MSLGELLWDGQGGQKRRVAQQRPPRRRQSDKEITTVFREWPKILGQGLREHYPLPRWNMSRRLITFLNQLKRLATPRSRVWWRKDAEE